MPGNCCCSLVPIPPAVSTVWCPIALGSSVWWPIALNWLARWCVFKRVTAAKGWARGRQETSLATGIVNAECILACAFSAAYDVQALLGDPRCLGVHGVPLLYEAGRCQLEG